MGNNDINGRRLVTFLCHRTLPEAHPISVSSEYHAMIMSLPVSNPVSVRLSDNPSLQEVLWKFIRVKDKKKRLTLRENPHFYEKLPKSPEGYGDSLKIEPTKDFRHASEFHVLADKPEMVCIMIDQISRFFGNFWCPTTSIIFKGLCVFFLFSSLSF